MAGYTNIKTAAVFLLILTLPNLCASAGEEDCSAWEVTKCLGAAGVTAATLPLLGFGAGGVAAGSVAAWVQSFFYGGNVAAGSVFATLQSAGAKGVGGGMAAGCLAKLAKCL